MSAAQPNHGARAPTGDSAAASVAIGGVHE